MFCKVIVLLACVCAAYAGLLPATYGYGYAGYAAAPLAVAAPGAHVSVYADNVGTFSYGQYNPYHAGSVAVTRNGLLGTHSYNFLA